MESLFHQPVSYRIPVFQRPYAWGKERQWEPLWEDVRRIAEKRIADPEQTIPAHFMGAIVLQLQSAKSGQVVKRIVVDGQQRLTTLQLLIKAAEECFDAMNDIQRAIDLADLTLNEDRYTKVELDSDTKVRQSNTSDLQSFQDVIRGTSGTGHPLRPIGEAHRFFKCRIDKWLNERPADRNVRAEALEKTIKCYLQLATVDLDEGEKPHFIFSVLNARAAPLRQSDHIKNTVMYEANVIDDLDRAREIWGFFDSNEWWRQNTKEGRLNRIHLDRFLNYWVVMKRFRDVNAENVSAQFDDYLESRRSHTSSPVDEIAKDLRIAGSMYRDLEEGRVPGFETFLTRMKALEIGVIMPLLLWIFTEEIPDATRRTMVQALESYLVRRMLCGLGSAGLNRLFVDLLERLVKSESDDPGRVLVEFLRGQTVGNRIWPEDSLLEDYLVGQPMKGTNRRQTMVLEAIELHLRTDKSESLGQRKLTREHIMPESWERYWSLPEGADGESEIFIRNNAIKEIGNLTLVSGKLNPALSNSPWDKKVQTLKQHTSLRLNWELLEDAPEVWNEKAISERSGELAVMVKDIWPAPSKF